MVLHDWSKTAFQNEDPDPYPTTNGGQTRHARGPVTHSSVTFKQHKQTQQHNNRHKNMASKRRFKGCQSDDIFQHMDKQPLLDIPDHDSAEFGRCELVFSQYELLRRICAQLPTQDLFRTSCGEI